VVSGGTTAALASRLGEPDSSGSARLEMPLYVKLSLTITASPNERLKMHQLLRTGNVQIKTHYGSAAAAYGQVRRTGLGRATVAAGMT
jgi:hypothetical protein